MERKLIATILTLAALIAPPALTTATTIATAHRHADARTGASEQVEESPAPPSKQETASPSAQEEAAPFEGVAVFSKGDGGSAYYRIPALATLPDGTLLAFADKRWEALHDLPGHIDVVCRRSTDGGRTWEAPVTVAATDSLGGCGDPAAVVDRRSGEVLCIFTHGNGLWESTPEDHAHIMVARSADGGRTWSVALDITPQLFGAATAHADWISAFASSGAAVQLEDGRLMFALVVRRHAEWYSPLEVYACYSDDGGYTWTLSENAADYDGDESKIAQRADGTLLMSIRNRHKGARKFSTSADGGIHWSAPYYNSDLIEPACNGDMIRYRHGDRSLLLHTIPNDSVDRRNVTLFASDDEGVSWRRVRTVCADASSYSALTVLPDGSVGILTEEAVSDGGFEIRWSSASFY